MLQSIGASHLLVVLLFVVLVLDSRRFHALARLTSRGRRRPSSADHGIPPGANPDQVGLPLRQIQMRSNVDWQDGGLGWDGPEILPVEVEEEPPPNRALPVLWKPYPAFLLGGPTPGDRDRPPAPGDQREGGDEGADHLALTG